MLSFLNLAIPHKILFALVHFVKELASFFEVGHSFFLHFLGRLTKLPPIPILAKQPIICLKSIKQMLKSRICWITRSASPHCWISIYHRIIITQTAFKNGPYCWYGRCTKLVEGMPWSKTDATLCHAHVGSRVVQLNGWCRILFVDVLK